MTDGLESLPERVDRIEQKLDAFDKRFDDVTAAFVEQRQYVEFAFDRLRTEMLGRFDEVDARFDRVDARLEGMDARFDRVDARLDGMDARFDRVDLRLDRVDARLAGMDARFESLERKIDQVLTLVTPRRSARPKKR